MSKGRNFKDFMALCRERFMIRTNKQLAKRLGISETTMRKESKGKVPDWWYAKTGLTPPSAGGSSPDLFALETVEARYGGAVADMVRDYPEIPTMSMKDIAVLAGVSREGVRQWIAKVHGTSTWPRMSAEESAKDKATVRMGETLAEIPELLIRGAAPIMSSAWYVMLDNGLRVLVRKLKWSVNKSGYAFASIRFSEKFAPNVIVAVIEGDAYVFHSPGFSESGTSIPMKKLLPFRNRFDYLDRKPGDIPRIRFGQRPKSGFMGVYEQKDGWKSKLVYRGKSVSLGVFKTAEKAAEAHDRAVLTLKPKRKCLNGKGSRPYSADRIRKMIVTNNDSKVVEAVL